MKNFIVAFLISALMLPTFIPLAPHEAFHALIVQHVDLAHHNEMQSEHFHEQDYDPYVEHENIHHHIPTDSASYFKDFLHVDLKNRDQEVLFSTLILDQNLDYDLAVVIFKISPYEAMSRQKRGPPIGHVFEPNFSSLYLTTLRLRI